MSQKRKEVTVMKPQKQRTINREASQKKAAYELFATRKQKVEYLKEQKVFTSKKFISYKDSLELIKRLNPESQTIIHEFYKLVDTLERASTKDWTKLLQRPVTNIQQENNLEELLKRQQRKQEELSLSIKLIQEKIVKQTKQLESDIEEGQANHDAIMASQDI